MFQDVPGGWIGRTALAICGDGLFAPVVESLYKALLSTATAYVDGVAMLAELETLHLVHVDLDAAGFVQGGKPAMATGYREERDVALMCEFYLDGIC